jgi:nucleoside-diphosphate-sugar epimerase
VARVLIAGCGDVGTALGLELARDGHVVFGLRRRADALPRPLVPVAADLRDPATLRDLPRDCDALVYAAAADGFDDAAYRAAYVDGLAHVLHALGAPPGRLVYTSSTAVYAQADGSVVDEDSPATPAGFSGLRLLEGERLARDAGGVVLRLAGIYGPGRTRLVDQVRAGTATCPDGPATWTNRIHRDDCAGAIHHLLALRDPAPLWVGVDDEPAPLCAVLDWLAARLGVPPPRRVPPGGGDGGRRERTNKRCSNARLRRSGWVPRHPTFRDGYAAMLDG